MAFLKRLKINQVFSPRSSQVNSKIYISRQTHETELIRSFNGSLHPLIFGHSGSGKSWLYKKVLKDIGATYIVANCANASRLGSIVQEISNCIIPNGNLELKGISEEISAEGNAIIAKGGAKHSKTYDIKKEDPLLNSFKELRNKAKDKIAIIVIDNLESIFDSPSLMDELANIIILSDDSRYAKYSIKLLIVGVPSGVLEYFSKTKNLPTVANRINELPELFGLSKGQVSELVRKGFIELLKANIETQNLKKIQDHISKITLGIPQRIHEYCEILAYKFEEINWNYKESFLEESDINFMRLGLRESYHVVESLMNERETKVGRRNQVVYTLGKVDAHSFTSEHLEKELRKEFPKSTEGVTLGIHQILVDISNRSPTIIKRGRISNSFQITDPRYLMVLRLILTKSQETEKVIKRTFRI